MNMMEKNESFKKTIDIAKSADELELQFSFVRGLVNKLLNEFINETEQSFGAIRRIDPKSDLLKREVSSARKKLKNSASVFEDKLENTIDKWKSEIKDDFKNPNKYDPPFI